MRLIYCTIGKDACQGGWPFFCIRRPARSRYVLATAEAAWFWAALVQSHLTTRCVLVSLWASVGSSRARALGPSPPAGPRTRNSVCTIR